MAAKGKKWIIGKIGLDGHDNGQRIVAKWLMNAGYEVVYAGLYKSPERIAEMVVEENAGAVGISFLGGEHLFYAEKLINELRKRDIDDVKIVIGGVIPRDDIQGLKALGVHAVFTPGTPKQTILDGIDALFG